MILLALLVGYGSAAKWTRRKIDGGCRAEWRSREAARVDLNPVGSAPPPVVDPSAAAFGRLVLTMEGAG